MVCPESLKDCLLDGIDNYEILEEMGQGVSSTVLIALCKRGRLRNRCVVLKKVPLLTPSGSGAPSAQLLASTELHQVLHHPTIVSLLSTFSTRTAHYRVVELCSRGTLSGFLGERRPAVLSESELRSLLKSVVDALIYLSKERIVHNGIAATNILLADDYRIKLAGFRNAIRLPAEEGSPAVIATLWALRPCAPVDTSADLWALGCLAVLCISGDQPFESKQKSAKVQYNLPYHISYEARDMIDGLLQTNPAHRIPLHRILCHPFFNPSLPVLPLGPRIRVSPRASLWTNAGNRKLSTVISPTKSKRQTLGDIGNRKLRNLLRNEAPTSFKLSPRRVVSEPLARVSEPDSSFRLRTPFSVQLRTLGRPGAPSVTVGMQEARASDAQSYPKPGLHSHSKEVQRIMPRQRIASSLKENAVKPPTSGRPPSCHFSASNLIKSRISTPPSPGALPIGTTRPSAFTTALVPPQTHKSSHGSVTVLPSFCLLVDFREGTRRRGDKGDEVLIVSADGLQVKVYKAPRLSVPSCLAEPSAVYALEMLPSRYWKQYNDAHRIVEAIKQKTPKMIYYSGAAKCTLMANTPLGDIEVLFSNSEEPCTRHPRSQRTSGYDRTNMRIRLSRNQGNIEVSRFVSTPAVITGKKQGEWTKKMFAFAPHEPFKNAGGLDEMEREGTETLLDFMKVCEAVEAVVVTDSRLEANRSAGITGCHSSSDETKASTVTRLQGSRSLKSSPSVLAVTPLSSMAIPPRPSKLSQSGYLRQRQGLLRVVSDGSSAAKSAQVSTFDRLS